MARADIVGCWARGTRKDTYLAAMMAGWLTGPYLRAGLRALRNGLRERRVTGPLSTQAQWCRALEQSGTQDRDAALIVVAFTSTAACLSTNDPVHTIYNKDWNKFKIRWQYNRFCSSRILMTSTRQLFWSNFVWLHLEFEKVFGDHLTGNMKD